MAKKKKGGSNLPDEAMGLGPDGKLLIVDRDAPAYKPTIVDDEGNEITGPDRAHMIGEAEDDAEAS